MPAMLCYSQTYAQQVAPAADSIKLPSAFVIVPATFITYGVVSLKDKQLKELNSEVKEELWLEHSHAKVNIDNYLQFAPAAAVFGLSAMGIKGKHSIGDQALLYGMSTAIMTSTVFATKNISGQLRPDGSDYHSFPSGHTATAFAAAEFMRKEYQGVSVWYGVAGYAMAATTGYLRMYNNKHWFSDVVAGAGVGILSTDLAYCIYPAVKRMFHKKNSDNHTILAPFYQQQVAGLSLVKQF